MNPVNNEKIPIWIADYVIGWYGTGAIMAVPAHDQRDFEFAKKYELPIKVVVRPEQHFDFEKNAYEGEGILIDSSQFNGYKSADAREEIIEWLAKRKLAQRQINYRLHDWVISRQRYWGVPIPMVNCSRCGYQPVSEKDLPVKLPKLDDFKPSPDGRSPLAKAKEWVKTKCPSCGGEAARETDTMDTFVDSSWYFLRYTDSKNKKVFADGKKMKEWLPVNLYIGGAEHNTMHLLYSRFFIKALFDLKLLDFEEPFTVRKNHGVILGSDGQKMSKSRGNVVDPDELVKKFGADAVRMQLAFMGPYDQGGPWNPRSINGVWRFLNRAWNLADRIKNQELRIKGKDAELEKILHRAIKQIGEDIENFRFNTAVSELMKLLNEIEKYSVIRDSYFVILLKLLAPFAPHLAEELWNQFGNKKSIHLESWPKYDPRLLKEKEITLIVQVNGKTRTTVKALIGIAEGQARDLILNLDLVKRYTSGKEIKKIIYIKDKLINIVV